MQILQPFGLNNITNVKKKKTASKYSVDLITWALKAKANILQLDNINTTIVINTTPIDRAFTFHDIRSGRKVWRVQVDLTRYGKDGVGFMHTKAVDVDQGCVVKYACVRIQI